MQVEDVVGVWVGVEVVVFQYYFEYDVGIVLGQFMLVQVCCIDVGQVMFGNVVDEVLDVQVFVGLLLVYVGDQDVVMIIEVVCDVFGVVVFGGEIQFVVQ